MQYKTTVLPQWQKKCQDLLPYHCVSPLFVGVANNYINSTSKLQTSRTYLREHKLTVHTCTCMHGCHKYC